jgi:anti-sigma factor NepR-like protein
MSRLSLSTRLAMREEPHSSKETRADRERLHRVQARQRAIGRELRRMYDAVVREPVPEEFLEILRAFDASHPDQDQD